MSRRPASVRALLAATRPTGDIPPDVRARSARRVASVAAVPLAVGLWGAWSKAVIAAVLLGSLGAAGLVASRSRPRAATERATVARSTNPSARLLVPLQRHGTPANEDTVRAVAPEARAPRSLPSRPPVAATPVERARVRANSRATVEAAPRAPAPPPVVTPSPVASNAPPPRAEVRDDLMREVALVSEAQRALGRDPEAALAITARHRAEFPAGHLLEDSEALSLDALHRLGRDGDLRTRGEFFLRAHPRSAYAARVRRWIDEARP